MKTCIYYSAEEETIYLLDHVPTNHDVLIGSVNHLPQRPAFIVQSLLAHSESVDITRLSSSMASVSPSRKRSRPMYVLPTN